MEYTIYASGLEEVIKKLDRLAKKAAKYGVPFGYEVGEEHPQTVNVYAVDPADGHCQYVERSYKVTAVDIEVNCEDLIKQDGWTVLAHIEHGDKGNIVTGIGNAEIDPAWYNAPARCDHCNTNRARAVTFMVQNANGEVRQVGKSCLKDYTGIAHQVALMWAEVRDLFPEDFDISDSMFREMRGATVYDTEQVIALAADDIAKRGYRKSESRDSTRDKVVDALREFKEPSAESVKLAADISKWLIDSLHRANEDADFQFYGLERDCAPLCESKWCKVRQARR